MKRSLFAERALLPGGWARDVRLDVGEDGAIAAVTPAGARQGAERLRGPALPGVPNAHSHAFQRGMAGLAEAAGPGARDSFWTWREWMYRFVGGIDLDRLEAIATALYVELVKAGYTSVAEFHYLHHRPDGRPWGEPAAASRALLRAAGTAGIAITLLPVLYRWGGFDRAPAGERQRPFLHAPGAFEALLDALAPACREVPGARLGVALHSLRAVDDDAGRRAVAALHARDPGAPVHVHVAEQTAEVDACLAAHGRRPVAHLLDAYPVDDRWCLVHATHVDATEVAEVAARGATVCLCPTTEANLGDGLFPLRAYLDAGGAMAIGSDSHVSVDPVEELRWLEYGQRLVGRRRAVAADAGAPHPGANLFRAAVAGGARAVGRGVAGLAVGAPADLVVLDPGAACLAAGPDGDALLDAWIFAGRVSAVMDVMVGGRWVVRDSRHPAESEAAQAYRDALAAIAAPPADDDRRRPGAPGPGPTPPEER